MKEKEKEKEKVKMQKKQGKFSIKYLICFNMLILNNTTFKYNKINIHYHIL